MALLAGGASSERRIVCHCIRACRSGKSVLCELQLPGEKLFSAQYRNGECVRAVLCDGSSQGHRHNVAVVVNDDVDDDDD